MAFRFNSSNPSLQDLSPDNEELSLSDRNPNAERIGAVNVEQGRGQRGGRQRAERFPSQNLEPVIDENAIATSAGDDVITADETDNLILASSGSDIHNGSDGIDTVSYFDFGSAITLEAGGYVNKGELGTDQIVNVESIIAPIGEANMIDGSTGVGVASFDIDLSNNSLLVNDIPGLGTVELEVTNFVDVIATPNDDSIIGNRLDNALQGGTGTDILTGQGGNDILTGVDPLSDSAGTGEFDVLNGGAGRDMFVLGDAASIFYAGDGFATIEDFSRGDSLQLTGGISDYDVTADGIFLAGTDDQIAAISGNFNPNNLVNQINFV